MKIALNCLAAGNRSGTGRYARGLLIGLREDLARNNPADTGPEADADSYVAFVPAGAMECEGVEFPGRLIAAPVSTRNGLGRVWWEAFRLPAEARARQCGLLHGTAFTLPRGWRGPSVVTVHDCAFVRHAWSLRPSRRLLYHHTIPDSIRRATRVVTDSEAARRDLLETFELPPGKVVAIPLGVEPSFRPAPPDAAPVHETLRRLGLPDRYVLFTGVIEPRKNLPMLLRAFAAARQRGLQAHLVLAGRSGWKNAGIYRLPSQLGVADFVHFAGYVAEADLPAVYQGADCFVYPSHYEGFGLPVLEAMACGLPVIHSDAAALHEVAGGAGREVAAEDVAGWTEALVELEQDASARAAMAARSLARARGFGWAETARQLRNVYREAAQEASAAGPPRSRSSRSK